jgi:tRNA 5-methylaminomethyl-2-thiouridine biosynthesis bifunctional protein
MHTPTSPAQDWQGHNSWCIAQPAWDLPAFLRAWAQWRSDPARPPRLHVLAVAAQAPTPEAVLALAHDAPEHTALLHALSTHCWGLLPGMHRLRLEGGHVLLTLCVGPLDTYRDLLAQHPTGPCVPAHPLPPVGERSVTVLGSGMAGAGTARALAERGWQVTVIDAGDAPAAGASGLPVGLVAPHTSPDDSPISRLSRAGVRCMQHAMRTLLDSGTDWAATGVQERRLPGKTRKGGAPLSWSQEHAFAGSAWTCDAPPPAPPLALWHSLGAWVRPARLVDALLQHPNIQWQGRTAVDGLRHVTTPEGPTWQVRHHDRVVSHTARVVVACGPTVRRWLATATDDATAPPMRPLRGQISWGLMADLPPTASPEGSPLPTSPVNGHGSFVHGVPTAQGPAWFAGSSYDRIHDQPVVQSADHAENWTRLQALLPETAEWLQPIFDSGVRGWAGVRCSVPDRLPVVGPVAHAPEGLWVNAAMGSRGLTLALLCGEVLAARWHGEPLPLEAPLARALEANRFQPKPRASAPLTRTLTRYGPT